ncbi:Uncharacterised protein [Mycobacteroides abscessus subsp. abscessus]|uniref:hypothetical protein n=1 Tax=Mycobacteroides abscessus TaxID=36809 RepID=UPI00092A6A97|nr:hypothetical protein [Mycobacteroides abscessus]SHX00715.1 Uncharacterised protein [Mycobacteroides abscessus subsp. abscessus]SHY47416.1 Uncharacterised protein [Mycobacteroides abscessus subsp. abscessus]SIA59861.1 Uncharacterised protein [Mycobacteroides abscessus subsp. abscessus]SKR80082.1 Uncharacterised protein [Mycobacteroides abscessus subsp. abscessus]SKU61848.1 Uncharacterised protein [Mycobacteroides abscessus subsp. abscessus]
MTKQLHLDIPGAQGDVHKLDTDLKILDEAPGRQLQAYQQLAGSVKGVGMDTATDFSREQNSAITSVHSVVEHCRTSTQGAINETIGYDHSVAGGKMTGQ